MAGFKSVHTGLSEGGCEYIPTGGRGTFYLWPGCGDCHHAGPERQNFESCGDVLQDSTHISCRCYLVLMPHASIRLPFVVLQNLCQLKTSSIQQGMVTYEAKFAVNLVLKVRDAF